jgi:hypothetical protein
MLAVTGDAFTGSSLKCTRRRATPAAGSRNVGPPGGASRYIAAMPPST